MPKLQDIVTKITVDTEEPHPDTKVILRACMPKEIYQQRWKGTEPLSENKSN